MGFGRNEITLLLQFFNPFSISSLMVFFLDLVKGPPKLFKSYYGPPLDASSWLILIKSQPIKRSNFFEIRIKQNK
jgi:hypothetical protein